MREDIDVVAEAPVVAIAEVAAAATAATEEVTEVEGTAGSFPIFIRRKSFLTL